MKLHFFLCFCFTVMLENCSVPQQCRLTQLSDLQIKPQILIQVINQGQKAVAGAAGNLCLESF